MVRLSDIMTRDVITVSPELPLRELMDLLVTRHVSGVPVVVDEAVVGVVSSTDILAFASGLLGGGSSSGDPEADPAPSFEDEHPEETAPPAAYFTDLWSGDDGDVSSRLELQTTTTPLDACTVADVMTRAPLFVLPPSASIDYAADRMRAANVHRVLVMTGEHLDGIVTTTDLANAVADHRTVVRTFVFDRRGQLS